MTNFVGIWLQIDFIMKGIILVCIYLRFDCFEILLLTRVDSSVMHKTQVGTRGSTNSNDLKCPFGVHPFTLAQF